jgi:hypothetical protein
VRGFSNSNIWALDIDNPLRPRKVEVTIAEESPGNWRASWWTTSDTNRSYFVAAVPAEPERLEGVKIPVWSNALAGAPHVVIAPPAMSNAAAALVAHRQQQGLNSLLVPVEELYDAFASGRRDPRAIQRFLTLARTNWAVPPAYACLAGDGHVDYFDFFGQAGTRPNHIPPLLDRIPYQTPGGTMVTLGVDNPLGDVNGDGNPEIAMGRLPAQTPAALTAMVNRIVQHESSDAWKSKLLLVADRDTNDIFKQACDRIAEHIPAGMVTGRLNHTASTPVETMRTNFIQGLNAGYALAVYVGHANNIGMSSPYFFEYSSSRSYMPNLTNTVRTPLLLAGTCMLNDFAQAHPTSRCIGKGFLDTAPGGAVAVWASAAASTLYSSEGTSSAILDKLFERHAGRLGDLIRPGLDFEAQSITPWVVRASVLLGDPGTRIRTHLYTPVTLHPSTVSVPATASAGHVFSVTSDVAWTAAPGAAWITVTGGATGSGDGPVTFSVAENIGPARTGSVLVAGGGMVRTGRVQQAAAQVTLTLAVEPVLGGSALGAGTYAVGQTAEITGAANSNWKFIRWSDGNTQNPRLLAVPVGGADLTAHFEPSAGMWPSGDMVVVNRRPQFFWQATSGATWYLVWIVRNGQKYMEQWVQEVTTWTPPSDLPSGQYQWWIRPWGPTIGTGAWSAEARFSIPLKLPGVLVQLAPTGVQATHNLTYRWQKDANATWYRLWVTRVGAGTWHDRWIEMSGTGEGAFQPGGAHPGPAKPVLSEPAGTLATNRPTFRWAGGACEWWLTSWAPDGNGPWSGPMAFHIPYPSGTWSRVFVNRGTTLALDQWTTNSNLVSPILLIRGNYSWWLGVWDSKSSQTIWSDRMDFTIP